MLDVAYRTSVFVSAEVEAGRGGGYKESGQTDELRLGGGSIASAERGRNVVSEDAWGGGAMLLLGVTILELICWCVPVGADGTPRFNDSALTTGAA